MYRSIRNNKRQLQSLSGMNKQLYEELHGSPGPTLGETGFPLYVFKAGYAPGHIANVLMSGALLCYC